ncbi:MAG: SRPBCC domain-containing protein [Flavobacteriales bacterium]
MDVTTIRQSATIPASPGEVYDALMNTRLHSRFTGQRARIGRRVGDPFSTYDGYIDGVTLDLEPGKRIIQSWRAHEAGWPDDHYSQVSYRLEPTVSGTRLVLQHERVPSRLADSFRKGWKEHYWTPLKAMFSQG